MSIFDSVISENGEKFNLGDKSGGLLAALLELISDQSRGGFAGFLNRFRQVGLGDVADSWVNTGSNTTLSGEQVESALGSETVSAIAAQASVPAETAKTALGVMIPSVVDRLTPDGIVPDESSLLTTIGGFLTGFGSPAASGIAGMPDRVSGFAPDNFDADRTAVGIAENRGAAFDRVDDAVAASDDNSALKWIIPLILLGLLIAVGWAFCRKSDAPASVVNSNVNAYKIEPNTNSNTGTANLNNSQ